VNQVGVSTSNSAGLQDLNSLQAASFLGAVAINVNSAFSGTTFPVGTRAFPVNNIADAIAIATERGLKVLEIMSSMTLGSGDFSNGFTFKGDNTTAIVVTIDPATNVTNCEFTNMTIQGTLDGNNTLLGCNVLSLNYVQGFIIQCSFNVDTITLAPGIQASFFDCFSNVAGGGANQLVTIDLGVTASLAVRNFSGSLKLINFAGGLTAAVSLDFLSGRCVASATVTSGTVVVRGICEVVDGSTGTADVQDHTVTHDTSILKKILTNRKVTDPATGIMTVYDDDDITPLLTARIWEDTGLTQPYRGSGIEEQERLQDP
jgi:hypothetical protein